MQARNMIEEIAAAAAAYVDGMGEMTEELSLELRRQWRTITTAQGTIVYHLLRFLRLIDWSEPWMVATMCFHLALLVFIVKSRERSNLQTFIFISGLSSVYLAERVNDLLAKNWVRFAQGPYFDREGVLVYSLWSGPMMLTATIILLNSLYALAKALVEWKQAELKYHMSMSRKKLS